MNDQLWIFPDGVYSLSTDAWCNYSPVWNWQDSTGPWFETIIAPMALLEGPTKVEGQLYD